MVFNSIYTCNGYEYRLYSLMLFFLLMGSSSTLLYAAQGSDKPSKPTTDSVVLATPLVSVNEARIKSAQKALEKKIISHKRLSSALMLSAAGVSVFEVYQLARSFYDGEMFAFMQWLKSFYSDDVVVQKKCTCLDADSSPKKGTQQAPSKWGNGAWLIGKFAGMALLHVCVGGAAQSLYEMVWHADSIFWCRDKQTDYMPVMEYIMAYVSRMEKNEGSQQDKDMYTVLLKRLVQHLVYQIEKIVGYMRYKGPLCGKEASKAVMIEQHLISKTNELIGALNKEMAESTGGSLLYSILLKEFREAVDIDIKMFGFLDIDKTGWAHSGQALQEANNELATHLIYKIKQLPDDMRHKIDLLLEENQLRQQQERRDAIMQMRAAQKTEQGHA